MPAFSFATSTSTTISYDKVEPNSNLGEFQLNADFSTLNGETMRSTLVRSLRFGGTASTLTTIIGKISTALMLGGESFTDSQIEAYLDMAVLFEGSSTAEVTIGNVVIELEHDYSTWTAVKAVHHVNYIVKVVVGMSSPIAVIEMKRGDMKRLYPVTLENIRGESIDLTGYEVRWCLYRANGVNPFLTKSSNDLDTENSIRIMNMEKAMLRITIASEDTKDLEQGRYYHEIQLIDSDQQVSTVASGQLSITNKV